MGKNRMLVAVLFIALCLAPLTARGADELFDSKAATGHIEKGIEKLKAGSYDAAIGEFEEAASISPEAEAYYYLGYTYYLKGRKQDGESRKKSLEYFESAYEIDPNFTPTRYKPPVTPEQPQAAPASAAPAQAAPAAPAPAAEPAPAPSPEQPKQ